MKIKLDEKQRNLLYAELEKEFDAVEMSIEELDSIVGGISISLPLIPKPEPPHHCSKPNPYPHLETTLALGEEDDCHLKWK